jgi:tetratricopeptide (TPR) repeat protein
MRHSLLICILLLPGIAGFTQDNKTEAMAKTRRAIKMMDAGDSDGAIVVLDSAKKLDPTYYVYDYEIGFAYQLKKDYVNAIKFFEASTKYPNTVDQTFQMLGNVYDMNGDSLKAISTYKRGLERFPSSGRLYLEYGVMDYQAGNYNEAVQKWEKGIQVEPGYPSSYYKLAKLFTQSDHPIWTIFYSEMFLNVERNSQRTEEISKLLYDTYKKAITFSADGKTKVDFTTASINIDASNIKKDFKLPFRMVYGMDFLVGLTVGAGTGPKELNLDHLVAARVALVKWWYDQKREKDYPNALFSFHKLLQEKGHLEAYNYWLMSAGDETAFNKWFETNKDKFKSFADWFNENPLSIEKHGYFIRPSE